MSADFPDRETWLAYRMPRPSTTRWLHVSTDARLRHSGRAVVKGTGSTYRVGATLRKRQTYALKRARRRDRRELRHR